MILLIMGVCGSGKTTVGQKLAEKLHWTFADADDFHPDSNRQKMSKGIPLTDEDRQPWLLTIHNYMQRLIDDGKHGIVTCSALKRSYRNILQFGEITGKKNQHSKLDDTKDNQLNISPATNIDSSNSAKRSSANETQNSNSVQEVTGSRSFDQEMMFIHLTGSKQTLQQRMETRQGHFMPASLLESQLKTLEPLEDDEPGIEVDIGEDTDGVVNNIIKKTGVSNIEDK